MSLKLPFKSDFVRNVATVMTGTAISQIIALALTPILTRNYTPEDFGFLLVYMSILSVTGTLSTGKFERAILLVNDKSTIVKLVFLSLFVSVAVSIILSLFFFAGKDILISTLDLDQTLYNWLYTLSFLIIIYSSYTVFNIILNYQKRFKRLASAKVIKTISSVLFSIACIFFLNDARGLILGEFLGYFLACIFVVTANLEAFHFNKKTPKESLAIAKRFRNFPLFNIPSDFMNMASAQMPAFFLTTYFGPGITGFYSLMKRVLDAPVNLFSTSILEVFRQKAAEQYLEKGNCRRLFEKTATNLILMAILPFSVLFFVAPKLFSFFFGSEWYIAGDYARIFAIYYFFKFISSPLSYMFYIAEKQKTDFWLHLYVFFSTLFILNTPKIFEVGDKLVLWIYCANFIFVYTYYFLMSLRLASGVHKSK